MQLLSLIFVLGLAITSAIPLFPDKISSENIQWYEKSFIPSDDVLQSEIFKDLRDVLRDNNDVEIFKKKVEALFGKGTELSNSLLEALKEEGKAKVIDFFNRLIGDVEDDSPSRSTSIDISSLKELRDILKDKNDEEIFIRKIEEVYGKGTKMSNLLIEALREEGKESLINYLNRMIRNKSSNSPIYHADFEFFQKFRKLRKLIKDDNVDTEKIKEQIEKFFGTKSELSEQMLDLLKGEKGKDQVLALINQILEGRDEEKRSIKKFDKMRSTSPDISSLKELRDILKDKNDEEIFIRKIEEVYGKGTKMSNLLIEALKEEGKESLINYLNRIIRNKTSNSPIYHADFEFFQKFRKLRKLIKDDNVDTEKIREQIEKFFGTKSELSEQMLDLLNREKGKDQVLALINQILEGREEKRSIGEIYDNLSSISNADFEFFQKFRKLKNLIKNDNVDTDKIKEQIETFFGTGSELSEQMLDLLNREKGKDQVLALINQILEGREEKRSIGEIYDNLSPIYNADFEFFQKFRKLRNLIKDDNVDTEKIKEQIEKFFGTKSELSEQMLDLLNREKGKDQVLALINQILEGRDEKRSIKEFEEISGASPDISTLKELRDILRDNSDEEVFIRKVEEVFGKGTKTSNLLIEALREEGKRSVLDYLNRLIRVEEVITSLSSPIHNADFEFFQKFRKLKNLIKDDNADTEKIKQQIEMFFGRRSELSEQMLDLLNREKGKDQVLALINQILEGREEKRSIGEIYDRIRDYFRDLHIEMKEKFVKFGEYAKEQYQQVLDKSKTRAENLKRIAQEFLDDSRQISKEIAEEALGFFREYKDDLGRLYNHIVSKVREITKKE